jgi:FkbM family methyltransferase
VTATRPGPRRLPDGRVVQGVRAAETDYLYGEIFEERIYLPDGGFRLGADPVVFDGGANIGMFSLFAAATWPDAVIHAFEPVPAVCDVLRQNLAGLPRAHAHQVALGAEPGLTTLTYYPGFTIMSGLRAEPARDLAAAVAHALGRARTEMDEGAYREVAATLDLVLAARFLRKRVTCRVVTLAWLARHLGCDRIDLLKLDVEGCEVEALLGLDGDTWPAVRNAVLEVTDESGELARVRVLLEGHGLATEARQLPNYAGTRQHIVYARRD